MRCLYFLFSILSITTVHAQETFNKRYDFNSLGALLTSVHPTDSCYYAIGIFADTVFWQSTGSIFAKFGLEGELEWSKSLLDPGKTYEMWFNNLQSYEETGFIASGFSDESGSRQSILIKYDQNGDTLSVRNYANPMSPSFNFMHPTGGMVKTADGNFIVSNLFSNSPFGTSDLYVMKVGEDGDIIWGTILEDGTGQMDIPRTTVVAPDGSVTVGLWRSNMNLLQENFTSQFRLVNFSPDGEIVWDYLSPNGIGLRDAANEMVMLDDGSLVIATGKGTEIERSGTNTIYFEKLVMKLGSDHEIEWEVTFEDTEPNASSRLTNIIELSDGSGFVVLGTEGEDLPGSDTYAVRGWLAKVNQSGGVGWVRKYIGIGGDNPRHQTYDLDETPDGGLILCGESRDGTNETLPPQQGWLLKLDKHGCLIPGCHLTDGAEEIEGVEIELAIYPNPAVDYLNFQLRGGGFGKKGSFRIVNMDGEIVREFTEGQAGDTYIVPMWEWAAGAYFLQYIMDGEIGASEKFIVAK